MFSNFSAVEQEYLNRTQERSLQNVTPLICGMQETNNAFQMTIP